MSQFVTLEQANNHLRLGLTTEELEAASPTNPIVADLDLKLEQAEAIVLDYLKVSGDSPVFSPSSPSLYALGNIEAAVLIILAALWDDREGTGIGDYLKPDGAVANLLRRLRDPAIA